MPIRETALQQPEHLTAPRNLSASTANRYFNAAGADPDGEYGEDRKNNSPLIPLALYATVGRNSTINIYGDAWGTRDGTCVRHYVHVEDIAVAHVLAMESQQSGEARYYNIGSNKGVTVNLEIIDTC